VGQRTIFLLGVKGERTKSEGGWEGTTLLTHLYHETQFISVPACAGYPTKQVKFHCILFVSASVLFLLVSELLFVVFSFVYFLVFSGKSTKTA